MNRGPGARVPLPSRSGKDRAREAPARAALSCRRDPPPAALGDGDPHDWRLPLRISIALLLYALVSWAILYWYFEQAKPRLNLGTLFLALDIPAFVWVIYQTGADNSWLFFLLYIRVADQTNTTFKRAVAFSHVAVASYALLILYLVLVEHRPISWPAEVFKLLILYGANLYVSLTARTAERMRARMVAAIRFARGMVAKLQVQSRELDEARSRIAVLEVTEEVNTAFGGIFAGNALDRSFLLTPFGDAYKSRASDAPDALDAALANAPAAVK